MPKNLPPCLVLPVVLLCLCSVPADAQVRITEFMASNTHTLVDEDGGSSDWIELQNTSSTNVNLLNWALTDSSGNPAKWLFPATNLASGSFMVVFASGKDRRTPGLPLHTNFKLDAGGEYLGLFRPDLTAATEISPAYLPQFPDVSYGIEMRVQTTTLVASNATIRFLIPANGSVDGTWTQTNFNDSSWLSAPNGIGYETGIADPQEESFAAKVVASQPVAYWRLNETNGPAAVNSGTEGVEDRGGLRRRHCFKRRRPAPAAVPHFRDEQRLAGFRWYERFRQWAVRTHERFAGIHHCRLD